MDDRSGLSCRGRQVFVQTGLPLCHLGYKVAGMSGETAADPWPG